jgi:hypothetical protein
MTKDISLRRLVAGSLLAGAAVFAPLAAQAQAAYPDPESAAEDFVRAVDSGDDASKTRVLGPGWPSVIPPGAVDDADRDAFLRMARERLNVSAVRAGVAEITVGAIETWTLPIPLKADAQGRWFFDLDGAREQIRERIIGRNELATIQAMLAFVDAQREYALADRNRDGVLEYAQRLVSSPGRQDGLIWDERRFGPSPLGPDFLPSKPGDYKIGGRLLTGFALLGWPIEWGETGVMSFMVDHTGRIVQRDLGPQTALIVQQILRYEPDAGWEQVVPASP